MSVAVSAPTRWSDVCRRFPEQWIVLVALDWTDDQGHAIRTAFLAGHGADRRDALAVARPLLALFAKLGTYHTSSASVPELPPIVHTTSLAA